MLRKLDNFRQYCIRERYGKTAMPGIDVSTSLLVHALCEERNLPILVTDLIAAYLDARDLFTISGLSRELNNQANPIIYHDIVLDLSEAARSGQRASLLFRTLLTSRTAAKDIRNLSLTGDPLFQWRPDILRTGESIEAPFRGQTPPETLIDLSTFTPTEIELYRKMSGSLSTTMRPANLQISLPRLCLDIIRLVRLQYLHVRSDYFRYPEFRNNLRDLVELGGFQSLQSSSLCLDVICGKRRHINVVRDWDQVLLTPFLAPDIKSIAAVMTLHPEAVIQLRVSTIIRLVLHHCQVQGFNLDALLAATPRLCYLEYHASVDYGLFTSQRAIKVDKRRSLGLDPLFDALYHVSDTLKELVTSQEFTEDSIHFHRGYACGDEPPFRQRNELSKLKHLHTLSIPYASFLGWTSKDDQNWEWHKILPASLRQITLTDHLSENFKGDSWTDESLMPVFSGLLNWLAMYSKEDKSPKFALLLLESNTDFNEPVRKTLSRLCEEHDILCSIEKLRKDREKSLKVHMPPRGRGRMRSGGRNGRGRLGWRWNESDKLGKWT